jgi:hypothetical protein
MSLQLIKDSMGNNTGVFIPIQEWDALSKENETLQKLLNTTTLIDSNSFVLTQEQINLLDQASNSAKNKFLNSSQFKEKLVTKYGVSL